MPDDDGDGVPELVETFVPGIGIAGTDPVAGDGNGDGIADTGQPEVASVPFRQTAQISEEPTAPRVFVTLVADSLDGKADPDDNVAQLRDVVQRDAPAELPEDIVMPLGLISFKADVSSAGETETFSLYVDPSLGVNGYWKQNSAGTWVNLASEPFGGKMVIEGEGENAKLRLDFQLIDGGEFDSDGQADGVISDPGAAGHMPLSIIGAAPDTPEATVWF